MPYSSLPPVLAGALTARGYLEPTPVQAAVIAPEAEGRDMVVSAQTGSGKTVAFGLAMADRDGRLLFANPAFMRAAGKEGEPAPTYPTDLVVQEDKGPISDAIRTACSVSSISPR